MKATVTFTQTKVRLLERLNITRSALKQSRYALLLTLLLTFSFTQATVGFKLLGQFGLSYWTIDYSHGFVRRGLAGSTASAFTDSHRTGFQLQVFTWAIAILAAVALLASIYRSWKRGSSSAPVVLLLAVASPLGIDFLLSYRRPDQFGFLVLAAYIFLTSRDRIHRCDSILHLFIGLAMGLAALIHEATVFLFLPWIVVVFWKVNSRIVPNPRTLYISKFGLLVLPSLGAIGLVLLSGQPSQLHVQILWERAKARGWLTNEGIYPFLGDTTGESFQRVVHLGASTFLGFALLLIVILGGHRVVTSSLMVEPVDAKFNTGLVPRHVIGWLPLISYAVPFSLGIDWPRWAAWYFVCWASVRALLDESPGSNEVDNIWFMESMRKFETRLEATFVIPVLCYLSFLHSREVSEPLRATLHHLFGF